MLTEDIKSSFKDSSSKLTGFKKRVFITQDYFHGSPRKAETVLGWSRYSLQKGLKELETGLVCVDDYRSRGRKKAEENLPLLIEDIESLLGNNTSTDPKFKRTLSYTRISAAKIREAFIKEKGYHTEQLPCRQTIGDIVNCMGYSLVVQKTIYYKNITN